MGRKYQPEPKKGGLLWVANINQGLKGCVLWATNIGQGLKGGILWA